MDSQKRIFLLTIMLISIHANLHACSSYMHVSQHKQHIMLNGFRELNNRGNVCSTYDEKPEIKYLLAQSF
jgi:hypothetical protein